MTSIAKTMGNPKFDPSNFNKNFEDNDKNSNKLINIDKDIEKQDVEFIILPHKEPVENLIINTRELFFQVLDMLENGENPLPYIFSSEKRQFSFSIFLIIFGTLLLLLSTLMVSP
jgi:hypothetical protein